MLLSIPASRALAASLPRRFAATASRACSPLGEAQFDGKWSDAARSGVYRASAGVFVATQPAADLCEEARWTCDHADRDARRVVNKEKAAAAAERAVPKIRLSQLGGPASSSMGPSVQLDGEVRGAAAAYLAAVGRRLPGSAASAGGARQLSTLVGGRRNGLSFLQQSRSPATTASRLCGGSPALGALAGSQRHFSAFQVFRDLKTSRTGNKAYRQARRGARGAAMEATRLEEARGVMMMAKKMLRQELRRNKYIGWSKSLFPLKCFEASEKWIGPEMTVEAKEEVTKLVRMSRRMLS